MFSVAASEAGDLNADKQFVSVLRIMSEEANVPVEQLTNNMLLADLGVDSLLSLIIGSRLRDKLAIDIDTQSMLTTLDSIYALRISLFYTSNKTRPGLSQLNSLGYSTPPSMEARGVLTPCSETDFISVKENVPPTTSFILQGSPRTALKVL